MKARTSILPNDLRADAPEEIATVLCLSWGEEAMGDYPEGGTAYRRYCDVRAVELSDPPRLLWKKRFFGGLPPDEGSSSNLYGKPPYSEIIEYLEFLPGFDWVSDVA